MAFQYGRGGASGSGYGSIFNSILNVNPQMNSRDWTTAQNAAGASWMMREQLPYATELEATRMKLMADEEAAEAQRNHQLELQRRGALQNDYQTRQQYRYQYGI